jgi:hypothetical protein
MKDQETVKLSVADREAPVALTTEQTAQVAGGLVRGVGCQTCTSGGRLTFAALAAELG